MRISDWSSDVCSSDLNMAAEFRAQRVWDSKQATYRRALQRHAAPPWERFVAEAGRIERIAKGRAPGDAWQVLERLLLVVADAKARPLVGRGLGAGGEGMGKGNGERAAVGSQIGSAHV